MSDLISRKALIQGFYEHTNGGTQRYLIPEEIWEMVELAPTAYDVGKVISYIESVENRGLGKKTSLEYIKKFIKGGGLMSELRRCPFCGGKVIPPDEEDLCYFIEHDDTCFLKDEKTFTDYTIEAWNRREPIDRIVEQLEKELKSTEYTTICEPRMRRGYDLGVKKAIEIVKSGGKV